MSEGLDNREYRQEKLKEVIKELHEGKTVEEVQAKFQSIIDGVSPKEIGEMEVQLVKEGLPIEEIQNLCDVHAAVFKGTLDDIHHPEQVPGHPIYTMKKENEALKKFIDNTLNPNILELNREDSEENLLKLREDFNLLWDIDKHYSRKENLIFPYLEKEGITAPPKVMWGVHDEIREKIKSIQANLKNYSGKKEELISEMENAIHQIDEMIFKEEGILFPMSLETLTEENWIEVYKESDEVGYAFIPPKKDWEYKRIKSQEDKDKSEEMIGESGNIKFENGSLSPEEIRSIFEVIPGEVSFVNKDDKVKFFSKGEHRIFTRTKTVIGREVENCHPGSVDMVERIVDDFKSGVKDSEDFWIRMENKFVLIRFFAVRNEAGEYLGTLEYVQDIAPLMELKGEKRLLDE